MSKSDEPVLGVPYTGAPMYQHPPPPQPHAPSAYYEPYHVAQNPYQAGMIPPNAIFGDPKGIPIHQTFFKDTPAPFNCNFCGNSGLTTLKSKPSLAAVVGCMMPFMMGVCFLLPARDCLWHKYHYCPSCGQKVADFEKSDPCIVMDLSNWTEPSFALTS